MSENGPHMNHNDFRRYRENRMSDQERHAFERELQKDPFLAEAYQGYEQLQPSEFESDLNELTKKINAQKSLKYPRIWFAAASILLLLSAGSLFYLLQNKPMEEEVAQVEPQSAQTATGDSSTHTVQTVPKLAEDSSYLFVSSAIDSSSTSLEETKKIAVKDETTSPHQLDNEAFSISELTSDEDTNQSKPTITKPIRIRGRSTIRKKEPTSSVSRVNSLLPENSTLVTGRVISVDDSLPIAGVNIIQKGSGNGTVTDLEGRFKLLLTNQADSVLLASFIGLQTEEFVAADSAQTIRMQSDDLALSEVVTVRYGSKQEVADNPESAQPAIPIGGMRQYRQYLKDHAILPADYPAKKLVVKVELTIDRLGKVTAIKARNELDPELLQLAKQIISDGPPWTAETLNNEAQESTVNLRIVFRARD